MFKCFRFYGCWFLISFYDLLLLALGWVVVNNFYICNITYDSSFTATVKFSKVTMSVVAVLISGPMLGVETKMVLYGISIVIRKIRYKSLAIFI